MLSGQAQAISKKESGHMKRSDFVRMVENDEHRQRLREEAGLEVEEGTRDDAIAWLARRMFDTYDLEDMQKLWVDFHMGDIKLEPLHKWPNGTLIQIADETVTWDDEE